ncbi:hypothetical protein CJ739_338 [Mariniflexile rhizosphaerae]|uniref:DUF4252 domain-containing protein n=1 Tax=unclassified Mariniflexile TaxID=2643887 RepID=UPI000CC15569|nr:DUF4252 domain-containing protein [Mariniflexile sp. TRM1-10]AXP79436.1 hypothetical protein CJ739_338 [Mariniflexile sp. TRM1-10]PLB19389.1 MAG: DUF4252 domain containing protein [Flavobacteriaceae bacterium FS1-H7996/R]
MNRTVTYIILALIATVTLVSCNDGASLQRYFVDHQESKNFMTQDIPISMLKIDETKFTNEQKEAYNSVERLNFLGYKANQTNEETLKVELAKVKTILSNGKYKDLVEFSDRGNKVVVKYIGNDEEADEVVVFGSSKELGFGIVRVLGDDMSPDKMVTLVSILQSAQVDKGQVQDIMNFFK